jgi:glyoxylase-like metal-dependent hydrolase (beta-lactamase superfamily II)
LTEVIPIQTFPAWGYLIVAEQIVAVDVGAPSVADKMADVVQNQLGRKVDDIRWIVATHYHVDHVGGISRLLELTPASVMFHKAANKYVEGREKLIFPPLHRWPNMLINRLEIPEPSASFRDLARLQKIGIPLLNKPVPFAVEGYYAEGDLLPGGGGFRVVETPGHTECSVCFYSENTGELISGDTIMGGKHGPEPNTFVVSRDRIAQSVRKLKKLKVRKLYPGHGLVLEGDSLLEDISEMPILDGISGLIARLKRRK